MTDAPDEFSFKNIKDPIFNDIYMPMMKVSAIIAAGRLGLFYALADGPLTLPALSKEVGASEVGVRTLADFLVTIGYLEMCGEALANTEYTTKYYTKHADLDYTSGLLWTAEAWNIMGTLAQAVKVGAPIKVLWDQMTERPEMGISFSNYMHTQATILTSQLVQKVPLALKPLKLLDLGGSHGLHAVSFCRRYPELRAVIFDMESALMNTGSLLVREGLSERISLLPGNLLEDNWGNDYDVVFYFWVAHNQTAEDNRQVVKRIYDSLNPGGLFVILEGVVDGHPNMGQASLRLTLMTETGTRTYSFAEINGWLTEAGFEKTTRIELEPADSGTLILARKTAEQN